MVAPDLPTSIMTSTFNLDHLPLINMEPQPMKLIARLTLLAVTASLWVGNSTADRAIHCLAYNDGQGNVVFEAGGSIDLGGNNPLVNPGVKGIIPNRPFLSFGSTHFGEKADLYLVQGPNSYGPGGGSNPFPPNSTTGRVLAIAALPGSQDVYLVLPGGYRSNQPISANMRFNNQSLQSLGMTVGNYRWNLSPNSFFHLKISESRGFGSTVSPEPTTALIWSMLAAVGLVARRRRA